MIVFCNVTRRGGVGGRGGRGEEGGGGGERGGRGGKGPGRGGGWGRGERGGGVGGGCCKKLLESNQMFFTWLEAASNLLYNSVLEAARSC
jgi:hypothetical protein